MRLRQYCQYHPATPAHWNCDACGKALCPECVDTRAAGEGQQGQRLHCCPHCNLPVHWLGVANIIDPFWKRIPRFFVYPLALGPVVLMLVLSLVAALLTRGGIIGTLAALVVWGVALKYAYSMMHATARGDLAPPPLNPQTLVIPFGPVLKQVGIYAAIVFTAGLAFVHLGLAVGALVLLAATVFLPAMIMLLVISDSLLQAINPVRFVTLAVRIGWGYLLMYFFCSILGGAPALLGHHVIQHLPPAAQLVLFAWVKLYYTFVTYHLMGYVILQHHDRIGYALDADEVNAAGPISHQTAAAMQAPERRLMRRVNQSIKDGDHTGAVALIEAETAGAGMGDALLAERYYLLLKMTGAAQKQIEHAPVYLDTLVRADRQAAALEVYRECVAADAGFAPSAAALYKIGGWLKESGNSRAAIAAFNRLTKAYPQDPLAPKSYFRAAQILNDLLHNPERAKIILTGLMKKYPDHDIVPFVSRYLAQIG